MIRNFKMDISTLLNLNTDTEIKKEIMEKETNYNILAERLKTQNRGI